MNPPVYQITDEGFEPLNGSEAVKLAPAVEKVMVETTRALSQIQAGMDLLASAMLRLASVVALQVGEK